MASPNSVFTELVTTTLRNRDSTVYDNVSGENAIYRALKDRGNVVTGGRELVFPLEYAENGTFTRYSGYDRLNIQASDVITAAKYDYVQYAIAVTASGRELRMNRGKEQMINLVNARIKNAEHTAANKMSLDMYSTGALSNQMAGLGHLIQENGQGTVGGINSATSGNEFWLNKFKEATGNASSSTIRADMHALWLDTKRGTDKTDLILSTEDLYTLYWASLDDYQRYSGMPKTAGSSFETLKFLTANVVDDDNDNFSTDAEKMFFLNTKYLKLVEMEGAQWGKETKRVSVDQDAEVILMLWMGQMICTNRARQGVLIDNTDS